MLRTTNRILIHAPARGVFRLAADIARWPQILPHYRWVRVTSGDSNGDRRADMAARHYGVPVRWISLQRLDEVGLRVIYQHIGGITKGMNVEWRVEDVGGELRVTITHELPVPHGLLRFPPARFVASRFFVRGIADKTLRGIKRTAEAESSGGLA